MSSSTANRLWVGPLLLVLVIALIYIFSLMPNGPPHRSRFTDPDRASQDYELHNKMRQAFDYDLVPFSVCKNGGIFNETSEVCDCPSNYHGQFCQHPLFDATNICLNGGYFSPKYHRCQCHMPWTGPNCQYRCTAGHVNKTNWSCECPAKFFGPSCQLICFNGQVIGGECICRKGFTGKSCVTCDPSYYTSGECDPTTKRRGAVNSRLTLSGLSFCMITIGLLCVTARRRRNAMLSHADNTWYRVFNPQPERSRCRHEFVCGGSWIPRDRALIVSPGRAAVSHTGHSASARPVGLPRTVTPPPTYTSVDNLPEDQAPPTYEEATQSETQPVIIEETQENKSDSESTTRETEE